MFEYSRLLRLMLLARNCVGCARFGLRMATLALFAVLLGCAEPTETEPSAVGEPETSRAEPPRETTSPRTGSAAPRWVPPDVAPPYLEARITPNTDSRYVVVPLHQPDAALGGLPHTGTVRTHPERTVVYEYRGDLYKMVADPIYRDAAGNWTYPEDPVANDERLSTPACEGVMAGFASPDAVGYFWVDPDGELAYRCPYKDDEPALHYVDGPTVEMGEGAIRSLGTGSRALRQGGRWGETWGIDDQGEFTPIDRPQSWNNRVPGPFLADRDGFLVVFLNDHDDWGLDGLGTLFRVYYDGSVVEVGAYGRPPRSIRERALRTLAPGGDLYLVENLADETRVFRFTPDSPQPGELLLRIGDEDPWQVNSMVGWGY